MPASDKTNAVQRVSEAFEQACAALEPLAPDARLLLACSAGGDSMTLLDLAARHAEHKRWALAVVHLDHRQRPESAGEARFVLEQASLLNIPVFIERLSDELIQASPLSEDVMRRARHASFRRIAHIWQATAILLAHQADDCAETFLIRLLAGSGPTGLSSIRPVEQVADLTLARPLLSARRADMRLYLEGRGIEWCDDPANADLTTKRGWVRGVLLPMIHEHLGLDAARIVRGAELAREEGAALTEATRLILEALRLAPVPPALARLDLAHPLWRGAGRLLRRQLLRQWLWDLRQGPHPPGYEAVHEALAFVENARPGAHLRTIERIHIVHIKTGLLAFLPETDLATRRTAARKLLPVKKKPSSRKSSQ